MEQAFVFSNNFEKARKEIKKVEGKKIIFSSLNDELNRKILEKEKIDVLMIILKDRRDKTKQRDSGFNQVMAKTAKKNKVQIGIFWDEIINLSSKYKSLILSRVRQNIKLCAKDKIPMKFIFIEKEYERDSYDLRALGLVLGMPTWMVKNL